MASFLVCRHGGLIEPVTSGQENRETAPKAFPTGDVYASLVSRGRGGRTSAPTPVPIIPTKGLGIRELYATAGNDVEWKPGTPSTITIKGPDLLKTIELTEGEHYYIGKDGKAYYHDSLKMILNTQGYDVRFNPSKPVGNSTIGIATSAAAPVIMTLREGTNYTIGSDWKSRFILEDAPSAQLSPTPAPEAPAQGSGQTSDQNSDFYDFIWPIANLTANKVSARFGVNDRVHTTHKHRGIDIAVREGTNVMAIADGKIFETKYDSGRGLYMYIDHGNGFRAVYQHLSEVLVKAGDVVHQGQVIALSGNTGSSTGAHLHLEVMKGVTDTYDDHRIPYADDGPAKEHVNPIEYLPKLQ
jgi:murein DD-endopeptidase MepM/ murein hydrolase activator NlpD